MEETERRAVMEEGRCAGGRRSDGYEVRGFIRVFLMDTSKSQSTNNIEKRWKPTVPRTLSNPKQMERFEG